jgi:hypothetical protein
MAKLHEIVAQVNTDLIANQFSSKKFQKGRFNGIAELMTEVDGDQEQTVPCIAEDNGDTEKLIIDDKYSFQLYHRHVGSSFEDTPESDFGDRNSRKEIAQMLMIIIGDRSRLKLNKEDIITGISLGMPLEMTKAFRETNSLQSVNIIQGEFNLDRNSVYDAEYNVSENMLKTNTIFLAFPYQIETIALTSCIQICE